MSEPDTQTAAVGVDAVEPPARVAAAQAGEQTPTATAVAVGDDGAGDLVDDELLVEEVSIDGMCGVY